MATIKAHLSTEVDEMLDAYSLFDMGRITFMIPKHLNLGAVDGLAGKVYCVC
jgi:hypothetical protein